jgi:aryl-alcohol dehydrogenase-like predicted oxidoreductase
MRVSGVGKDISQLILGCDGSQGMSDMPIMLDRFFELGGTAMDTAHLYSQGRSERMLGGWVKSRGVREQVAIITKGAHTPDDHPSAIAPQLAESLERLQMDDVEIYLLHRDNLEVPVGEWASALAEQHKAGRIGAFGGSNWSAARIDAFNEYADAHDLPRMTFMSNNYSLARMVNATWEGCLTCSDPATRQWLINTQTPNIAWSSQARGFFSPGRAAPYKLDDELMVHTWYSDDNFERLARADKLAAEKGVDAINIALAYVLQQPFPQFAVVGPQTLAELRGLLRALDVTLTPDEMAWLNVEQ